MNRPFLAVIHKQNLLPWVFRRMLNRLPCHVPQTQGYVTTSETNKAPDKQQRESCNTFVLWRRYEG